VRGGRGSEQTMTHGLLRIRVYEGVSKAR
jgi:hypothetical protein